METRAEIRHVTWPTREQAIVYTIGVVVLSLSVSIYLGLFDFVFRIGMTKFLGI